MRDSRRLTHEFVEYVPDELNEGTIYVSIPFATVLHKCCCGCGNQVVTPLSPTDWKVTFDGDTISVYPSIGNWGFECQSHYWIENDTVKWAEHWSKDRIEAARSADRMAKEEQFREVAVKPAASDVPVEQAPSPQAPRTKATGWLRFFKWW